MGEVLLMRSNNESDLRAAAAKAICNGDPKAALGNPAMNYEFTNEDFARMAGGRDNYSEQKEKGVKDMEEITPMKNTEEPPMSPTHTGLLVELENIERTWIEQLREVRESTLVVERQAIACVARVKDDISRLHLLGRQLTKEAARGKQLCQALSNNINRMMKNND
jgi:hypothetical protein